MTNKTSNTHPHSYNASQIDGMDQRVRANFINSLSGFKSANLIGTRDKHGVDNLAIVSSVFHIGANPPLLGMIMRPHTVVRDTLQNIKDTGVYTINHVNTSFVEHAHQTSARYEPEQSEFEHVGLSKLDSDAVNAPYVAQSNIVLSMQVQDIQLVPINKTELVIGQIVEVLMNENYTGEDGYVDIEKAQTAVISGLDSYHQTTTLGRFSYAKPNQPLTKIKK